MWHGRRERVWLLRRTNRKRIPDVVTIVTETRVLPEHDADFAPWQQQMTNAVTKFPGLIDHQVISPQPPTQLDWVILQKFASSEQAQSWLRSPERQRLLATAQPWFVGKDDIHIIAGDSLGPPPSAVSAVISTKVIPGQEEVFRGWSQRIASAETQYPGFQGHRIDPPIPGVQDDWTTILTFDTEQHLNDWMNSAERQKLLTEAAGFTEEMHTRTVRSGFEQWFRLGGHREFAGLEAEHGDAAGALPGRLPVRLFRRDPDPVEGTGTAVLAGPLPEQHGQRGHPELGHSLAQRAPEVVAATRGRRDRETQSTRNRPGDWAVCGAAPGVLPVPAGALGLYPPYEY